MKKLTPFNIELMTDLSMYTRMLRPVVVTDIYDGLTSNFHDGGLFSTTIFGRVGTPDRDKRFSYITLNASVVHPVVFDVLKRIKRLYHDIMMGRAYAEWDPEAKDFVSSDIITGETGMAFFLKHLNELQPDKRSSNKRNLYVDVFEKYRSSPYLTGCLVIPAGYRDLTVDQDGREVQDEINDLYRKLIAIANNINLVGAKQNDPAVDIPRRNLQYTMNEIYEYLRTMLEGKKGIIQSKWGGRRVVNSTRNVISSMDTTAEVLGSERSPQVDDLRIGLFQTMKGALPITIYYLKQRYLDEVFSAQDRPTPMINMKTLKLEDVDLDPFIWDRWGTVEGIEKIIDGFSKDELRNKPIVIQGRYLYLTYRKDDTFKIFRDISELPDPEMIKHVHPTTHCELFYTCNYTGWYNLRAVCTRYPINNMYSIFPAKIYTMTNTTAQGLYELDHNWEKTNSYAREFPDSSENVSWVNTAQPHYSRLKSLGADYDGDTVSVTIVYSREATREIDNLLASKKSIIGANGKLIGSADTNIPARVFSAFT